LVAYCIWITKIAIIIFVKEVIYTRFDFGKALFLNMFTDLIYFWFVFFTGFFCGWGCNSY
jgi:hypothetical protein